jgi:opacity protein-like surface antigen
LSFNPAITVGTLNGGVTMQATYSDPWSMRARIGYAQPAYMVYATGGFAQLNVGFSGNWLDCGLKPCAPGGFALTASASTSQERSGWVAGAGIEWKPVPGPWILGLEYLHYGFDGTTTASGPVVGITPPPLCSIASKESSCMHFSLGNIDLDSVRVRLSYKFTN